ncbi:hypothetical protein [Deinococcus sp. Leaf326]|uniref:hypothetical protein n=1 Tax=Deinococcus sp. Leaf326 TaxID=1736338 RepID=UPI0006F8637E|nr:hypothetical protein [Deinococcus sp. Leaf326]KQR15595.1 hypothetical protein ASF71_08125 [Deinococcus sp. Leaf326]
MQEYATHSTTVPAKARAITRTWNTVTHDCMDGAVVQVRHHTVTLTRTDAGLVAEIDGQPANILKADQILRGATFRTVTAEVLEAPATIGKARAYRLHKIMGRLGLHEHYGLAARALGRDVFSLAALTEAEARTVWAFVVNLLPHARELAAA